MSVIWLSWGAAPVGAPRDHKYPCDILIGRAWFQRRAAQQPYFPCGGSLAFNMVDDALREGKRQGRGTEHHLPGACLPPSGLGRSPHQLGGEYCRVLSEFIPQADQLRAPLQGRYRLDTFFLHRG